jgi:hypothetical protein
MGFNLSKSTKDAEKFSICNSLALPASHTFAVGGISRTRSVTTLSFDAPDHPLGTTNDVSTLLANAMGYLAAVLLRALEQGPLEERLTKIEELLG